MGAPSQMQMLVHAIAAHSVGQMEDGGGGGIRTHETLSGLTVFKTAAFNRSATPPKLTACNIVTYDANL
jgi:hypothetical protein